MSGGREKQTILPRDAIQACDLIRARNRSWRHPVGWLECAGCYYVSARTRLSSRGCDQVDRFYKKLHRKMRDEGSGQ